MADFKKHMFRHLRSASQWLEKAEESFDKDSNVRGELDLILAQAELQRARETNHAQGWRYKYPLLRHAVSAALAVTIMATGFGAYWWLNERNNAVPIPLAMQENPRILAEKTSTELAATIPSLATNVQPATTVAAPTAPPKQTSETAERQDRVERSVQPAKENLLPPDEMQKLIRTAGKSLRGQ